MKIFKKLQYWLWLVCIAVCVCSEIGYASGTSNTVYLYKGDGVSDLKFTYEGNKVTSGESHDDKLDDNDQHDDYLYLQFHADRKGSSEVADSFNSKVNNDEEDEFGLKADPGLPDDMNFYFYGELYINGNVVIQTNPYDPNTELYAENMLGQTHQDGDSNWWFGSTSQQLQNDPAMQEQGLVDFDSSHYMTLVTESNSGFEQYCVSQHDDDYYKFTISRCGLGNRVTFNKQDDVNSISLAMSDDGLQVPTHTENGNTVGDVAYYPKFTKYWDDGSKRNYLVNVDRQIDKGLATSFNTHVGTGSNMIGLGDPKDMPDDLYFYYGNTMKINDSPVINTVYLGQGNDNGSDWWFGTAGSVKENNQLAVYTEDGQQYCLSQDGDSNDTFNVSRCGDEIESTTDNEIRLYYGKGVNVIKFDMQGAQTSTSANGQSLSQNSDIMDYLDLDFKSVNTGSEELTSAFESMISVPSQIYAVDVNSTSTPSPLQFILTGNLTINDSLVTYPVSIAKELDNNKNGVWLGSLNAWKDSNSDFLWVKTQDEHKYCISNGDGGSADIHSFMISNECPDSGTVPVENGINFEMGSGVTSIDYTIFPDATKIPQGQPYSEQFSQENITYSDDNTPSKNFALHAGLQDSPSHDPYMSTVYPLISSLTEFEADRYSQGLHNCYYYYQDPDYFMYKGELIINNEKFHINIGENKYKDEVKDLPPQSSYCIYQEMDQDKHQYNEWWLQAIDHNATITQNKELELEGKNGKNYCIESIYLDENHVEVNGFNHKFSIHTC